MKTYFILVLTVLLGLSCISGFGASKTSINDRPVIVVIDPGHGGKDPGATGPGGHHEKNVVLPIGKDVQADINKVKGFKALLTRHGDYYLYLRQRLRIARKDKANMFMSVHADAFKDDTAEGASVFALSLHGATSEAARWLAQRENQSELMGGVQLDDKTRLLRSLLINLSQQATITKSLAIGEVLLHNIGKLSLLHHGYKVEQAAFVVLKSPDIPSLLVETGFISNPAEEAKLINPVFQHKMARALADGIVQYFKAHPPRGTWLYDKKKMKYYSVVAGDTLSKISRKFDVTIAELKHWNRLKSSALRVGQKIMVVPHAH